MLDEPLTLVFSAPPYLRGALKSCFISQILQLRPNQRSPPRLRASAVQLGFRRFFSVSQCLRGGFWSSSFASIAVNSFCIIPPQSRMPQ